MKSFKQLLEDIQAGPAPEEISYKGYTTKNLHHVPDAAKAFQATITRVQKGTLQDNGEVLAALKATDTYMKLNDMHMEQEKDLDSQELDQWLAAHEEAKSALTKIGEFEHHYDYWNSHNAELQYLKANQNMPQEAESVQIEEGPYSSGQLKASPEQLKQANKVPSGGRTTTIVDRDAKGVYTLTMKDGKEVSKVYKESTEIGEASKLQGTPVVSLSDFGGKDTTKNKYGQTVPKKLKPNDPRVKMYTEPKKEGVSEGLADDFLAMAKNRNPNARIVTAVQKRKEAEETMKNREASGTKPAQAAPTSNPRPLGGHDPKSGRSYSESVEIEEAVTMTKGGLTKTVDRGQVVLHKKLGWRISENVESIDEISTELKQKYLAAATKKHLQQFLGREKVRDKQELDKRRAAIQKTSKELTGKTHYQESVETVEEASDTKRPPNFTIHPIDRQDYKILRTPKKTPPKDSKEWGRDGGEKKIKESVEIDEALDFKKEAAKHMKDMHDKNATPANKAYAQKMLKRALEASKIKDKVAATKHYMGEEIELEELRNVTQDQLGGRMGSSGPGFNKTPAGKEREVKRKQEHLKGQMQFTKSQGGIAGPKGKLPEEVELDEAVKKKLMIGSKVSHPVHGKGMVVMHSLGGGTSGTVVKFADGKKIKVDHKKLRMEEVELDEKTLTPAELKKREEVAKAMERKNPNMDKSRKMAIATAVAKRVAEQYDDAE